MVLNVQVEGWNVTMEQSERSWNMRDLFWLRLVDSCLEQQRRRPYQCISGHVSVLAREALEAHIMPLNLNVRIILETHLLNPLSW